MNYIASAFLVLLSLTGTAFASSPQDADVLVAEGTFAERLQNCIRPRVVFNAPPPANPDDKPITVIASFVATLSPSGDVRNVRIDKSSGNDEFDKAVVKGVAACSPFPRLESGSYPKKVRATYSTSH